MHAVAKAGIAGIALGAALFAAGCEDGPRASENAVKNSTYETLVANQPAEEVTYSPSREAINHWIRTWGQEPGRNAYVYLQNASGDYSYFVLKGLPVSYCAQLTSPVETTGDSGRVTIPSPAMDGVYYTAEGPCNTFYGIDATTGAYVEFSVGVGQNYFLYSELQDLPEELEDAVPMGPTTIEDAVQQ